MALDLFIGICGALCLIVGGSILLGKLVMWIQEKLRLRREEKELGRIVQQQKRWEALERELFSNDSATDMALDPKPWGHLPASEQKYVMNCLNCGEVRHFEPNTGPGPADRMCSVCGLGLWTKEAEERGMKPMDIMPWEPNKKPFPMAKEEIQEAPHTMWCPRCGSHKRHLAHAVGGVPYHKCEDCGQRYKQSPQGRWDRNAVEASPAAPTSEELKALWDSGAMNPTTFESDVVFTDYSGNQASLRVIDDIGPFGGGDFGGSGAGDSYDSSGDSDSSSTDSSSSSDYSSSNDD